MPPAGRPSAHTETPESTAAEWWAWDTAESYFLNTDTLHPIFFLFSRFRSFLFLSPPCGAGFRLSEKQKNLVLVSAFFASWSQKYFSIFTQTAHVMHFHIFLLYFFNNFIIYSHIRLNNELFSQFSAQFRPFEKTPVPVYIFITNAIIFTRKNFTLPFRPRPDTVKPAADRADTS